MKVLFRCDAYAALGLGHLSRCLNLADAIARRGGSCTVWMRALAPDLSSFVRARGHAVERFEGADDLEATLARLTREPFDWLVVDHYGWSGGELRAAARHARLAVLDDLADRELDAASLVVNPTPGSEGWYPPAVRTLCGPKHALLAPEFARAHGSRGPALRPPRRVLVTLGGGGDAGPARAALRASVEAFPGAEVRVIRGPAAGADDGLEGATVLRGLSAAQMVDEMIAADLAIATASTTAWELACVGVPTVLQVLVENQVRVGAALADLVPVCRGGVGLPEALRRVAAPHAPFDFTRWFRLVDGRGAERCAEALEVRP